MQIILKPEEVTYPQGVSIAVEGFKGDVGHVVTSQVFVEVYEGQLRIHVWDGDEDPVTTTNIEPIERVATTY